MNITERDIFNFVFDKESSSQEIIAFLHSAKMYEEEIAFYESLKKSFNEELGSDVRKKLSASIPAYSHSEVIELFPFKIENGRKKNVVRYAADSPKMLPKIIADTYFDSHSEYMIRVLRESQITKIFVFSVCGKELKNFKIVLYPAKIEYDCLNNIQPLEIDNLHPIEKINLVFN